MLTVEKGKCGYNKMKEQGFMELSLGTIKNSLEKKFVF